MTPSRSESSRLIDELVRSGPHGLLKSHGYRKAGRSFWCENSGGVFTIVNFQASQWNTPEEASFAVNLQVTLAAFHESWTGTAFPKNPASAAALVSQRLGLLMPGFLDKWWEVRPGVPVDDAAGDVTAAIESLGLPFLESLSDEDALLTHLMSSHRPKGVLLHLDICRAIMLHHCGRHSEATEILTPLAMSSDNRHTAASVVGQRLGLLQGRDTV